MKMMKDFKIKTARSLVVIFSVFILSIGCSPLISKYDQYSYQETTSLKVDALNLIANASDSISKHLSEVNAIDSRIEKLYEYEKGKPKNTITTQQWDLLKSPDHDLYGGFIKEWKNKAILKPAYVLDKKDQIGKAFDLIIKLEAHKIKDRKLN
jgi:hypothetical protein